MNLRDQLKEFEGVVPHAYEDHLGFVTVGVGRLIDARKGGGLSDDEIDYLLDNDIRRVRAEVDKALPWVASLNEPRQAVVYGMAFQMGTAGLLSFRNTLAAMKRGDFGAAAQGMKASLWAKQTPGRVKRLAKQLLTGEWA